MFIVIFNMPAGKGIESPAYSTDPDLTHVNNERRRKMNLRKTWTMYASAALVLLVWTAGPAVAAEKPNILVIWGTMSAGPTSALTTTA